MSGALDWLLGTLAGDFNEDPTTSQVIVGSLITAIPFVDQLGDIRDIIANLKKVHEEPDEKWAWVALVVTLIGLIPVLGSLLKGVLKLLVRGIKKGGPALDEALHAILAMVRGAGKGDPVKYLKSIPWGSYGQDIVRHFNKILDTLKFATADLQHRWLARRLISADKLALISSQIDMLQRKGQDQIPKVMTFLKAELDKLLARVKPERIDGTTSTTNTLKHSEKPLLRIEYEVASKRMNSQIDAMRKAGKSDAEIAQYAVAGRQRIQEAARAKTDPELVEIFYGRNLQRYNNATGPAFKRAENGQWSYLERNRDTGRFETKYKSDAEVINSSTRSGGDDLPWDKVLEFSRAKARGDRAAAAALKESIQKAFR
jgi:hypothetical protein